MSRHWEAPFNDQRRQLLEEVTRALSAPGDVVSTMRRGAGCVVPALAQSVVLVVRQGIEDRVEVVAAQSGEEAATALEQFGSELDLVVSDVILPDMAATELERRVNEGRQDLPVLYMSAYSREEVRERSLIPSDRPFIQKPFTAAALIGAVWREMDAKSRPVVSG